MYECNHPARVRLPHGAAYFYEKTVCIAQVWEMISPFEAWRCCASSHPRQSQALRSACESQPRRRGITRMPILTQCRQAIEFTQRDDPRLSPAGGGGLSAVSFAKAGDSHLSCFLSYAFCRVLMSIFTIFINSAIALWPLSGSIISWPIIFGTICHDTPNLSFSHPHWLSRPPSAVSFSQ